MKKERREVITMTDNGIVPVSGHVKMNIGEIADLFDIYYRTVKQYIRSIEKSGIVSGDYSMCCTVEGQKFYPEYYGLDMVIALAFRAQSPNYQIFIEWLYKKATRKEILEMPIISIQNDMLNGSPPFS